MSSLDTVDKTTIFSMMNGFGIRSVERIWRSPMLNTFASFLCRTFGMMLVLTLALKKLSASDFNVWSLFSVLLGFQILCDMGFCITFVRAIAVALAGADSPNDFLANATPVKTKQVNWGLVDRLVSAMRFIYHRLALIYIALMLGLGSLCLVRPISQTSLPDQCWIAWIVIVGSGYLTFRSNYQSVLLTGLNEISLVRRSEAYIAIGSAITGCCVLYFGGGLLSLVIATQIWAALAIARNRWLLCCVAERRFQEMPKPQHDPEMIRCLWPATWRSGIGILTSLGLTQATGLINAQFVSASASASYLLSLKMIQMISAFSQAPFYSQISLLPRLRAEGKIEQLLAIASKGMRRSLWFYSGSFALVGLLGPTIFRWIGSQIEFPKATFWVTFGAFLFIERFAAMHLLLYSTTNKIITHVSNGITAVIAIISTLILLPFLDSMALPMGLLCGYLAFYSWYPVWHSYREFGMSFVRFESRSSLGPLICFILASALMIVLR
ncbi:MAG: hypothetical protein SGI77_01590 [Pirellulaceae bacterium]|nr:hypothetical protein [Pirellulaceae bacterium]